MNLENNANSADTSHAGEAKMPVSAEDSAALSAASSAREARLAFGSAAAYFLLYQITPLMRWSNINIIGATTFFSLIIVLLFTVSAARAIRSPRALFLNLAISGGLSAPIVLVRILAARFPEWPLWLSLPDMPVFEAYMNLIGIQGLYGLILVWFAVSLGVLLTRLVREFKILLPIGVVLALVDIYVVFGGGLVTVAESGKAPVAEAAMTALTIQLPTARPSGGAAPMLLSVGFADFLFIAMFFACFLRFGIPSRKTFVVLCAVLVVYMLSVVLTNLSLPALIPIALVCIGMNLRHFRFERSEAFALLYAGIIVITLLTFLVFYSRR